MLFASYEIVSWLWKSVFGGRAHPASNVVFFANITKQVMVKFGQRFLIELKLTIRVKVLNAWDWVRCAFDNVSWGGGVVWNMF